MKWKMILRENECIFCIYQGKNNEVEDGRKRFSFFI